MSKLSQKLDVVNASYPSKYNSIVRDFHTFSNVAKYIPSSGLLVIDGHGCNHL